MEPESAGYLFPVRAASEAVHEDRAIVQLADRQGGRPILVYWTPRNPSASASSPYCIEAMEYDLSGHGAGASVSR
jgi:hypothetical protein